MDTGAIFRMDIGFDAGSIVRAFLKPFTWNPCFLGLARNIERISYRPCSGLICSLSLEDIRGFSYRSMLDQAWLPDLFAYGVLEGGG